MTGWRRRELVLAVYPYSRGISFTLFEGPLSPLDWGTKQIRGPQKNALTLEAAKLLIEIHQPDVLVLQTYSGTHGRRAKRVQRLQRLIKNHATAQVIDVFSYTRKDIKACFADVGAVTRYEIAQSIASQIAAFSKRLPPVRQLWESEDARMGLFDSASLAMTFYCRNGDSLGTDPNSQSGN
jgi:hypothetical protein